jgi:hypothetical protein
LLKLESKIKWRTIAPEDKNRFIELTKEFSKFPTRVRMGANPGAEVLNIPVPSSGAFKMSAFMGIQNVFNGMGITTEWLVVTNLPKGVCEIFIEPKF